MTAPRLLSPAEAAALLRVSVRTLRTYKRRGLIAWVPCGPGGVSYREEDVQAFCASQLRRNVGAGAAVQQRSSATDWLQQARREGRVGRVTGRRYGEMAS